MRRRTPRTSTTPSNPNPNLNPDPDPNPSPNPSPKPSPNAKQDFYNLVNVYLDAVLHPRAKHDSSVLQQEGWHYELEDPKEPLTYKVRARVRVRV